MMKIECYEVKSAQCGNNYFNGGCGNAMEYKIEHFATEAEANKACAKEMKKVAKQMAWCDWWVEKYVKPENYTVKKVVVKL